MEKDSGDDSVASQATDATQATVNSDTEEAAQEVALKAQGLHHSDLRVTWSKADVSSRESIRTWLNSSCFRAAALEHLQEPDDPALEFEPGILLQWGWLELKHQSGVARMWAKKKVDKRTVVATPKFNTIQELLEQFEDLKEWAHVLLGGLGNDVGVSTTLQVGFGSSGSGGGGGGGS
ncbi:hypothetical protein QBC39DRAFT_333888 [Podospora conica]|nr:hypothetical protein QBC39DRAFT_333888 [Schizothecium conicum]